MESLLSIVVSTELKVTISVFNASEFPPLVVMLSIPVKSKEVDDNCNVLTLLC